MPAPLHHALARRKVLALLGAIVALALVPAALPAPASAAQTPAVHAHLLWARYDSAAVTRQLDMAKEAGAGMVRVDLGWASLEQTGKGRYNSWYLGKIDHVVSQAEARGIKVLFTFWETPCWASTAPDTLKQGCEGAWWDRGVQRYPPANPSDFGEALAFLVKRYGRRVAAWELWNEPNHPDYLKSSDPVSSYAALVKAAYPAAKAANPSATVIAGSLADADFDFTEALYAKGVKGNFDAWSVHPYSEDRSPLQSGIAGWEEKSFAGGVPRVRDTMLRHGDDKPLWLTEFGWSTCNVRGLEAYRNCVDPDLQAYYLQLAYKQMQSFSYVPVGVSFNLQDTSSDLSDRVDNYGIFTFAGQRKPALSAFQASSQALAAGKAVPAPAIPASAGSSSPAITNSEKPKRAGRSISLRVTRRRGRIYLRGTLSVGRTLHVRAYRWKRQAGRFSRRTSYRKMIRVSAAGRFSHRIASRAFARGKWKVTVTNRRRPPLRASKIVR